MKRIALIWACVWVAWAALAQTRHTVKEGETLFRISRQYGVSVAALEQSNNIAQGTAAIHVGQQLIIPPPAANTTGLAGSHCREMHRVQKKETLYSIAQRYGITVEMLQHANPETRQPGYALKKDTYLCIPFNTAAAPAHAAVAAPAGLQRLRIGVLLPFKGSAIEARQAKEFYQGLLLAVDSMSQRGVSIEVVAMPLSTAADMAKIEQSALLPKAHVLFAPFDVAYVEQVADYGQRHKIATIVPYASRVKSLASNPYLYLLNPPSAQKDDFAIAALLRYFATQPFVFVTEQGGNEQAFVSKLKAALQQRGRDYTEVAQSTDAAKLNAILEAHRNAIVLPDGSDEARLKHLLSRMKVVRQHYGTPFTLLGYPQWQLYAPAHVATLNALGTYIYTPFYSSLGDARVRAYCEAFAAAYGQPPTNTTPSNAMMGFDAGLYFMLALQQYGVAFGTKSVNYEGVQSRFDFERYTPAGGYVNSHIRLVHYN